MYRGEDSGKNSEMGEIQTAQAPVRRRHPRGPLPRSSTAPHDGACRIMGAAVQCAAMNQQETIARLGRAQEEVRQFASEQDAPIAKDARTLWLFPIGGMVAGAALFGAGLAFMKLMGT